MLAGANISSRVLSGAHFAYFVVCCSRMCSLVLAGAHFLARVGFPMLDSPRFSTHISPSLNPLAL